MDATCMENTSVNWSALDALVLDYAEAELLLDHSEHISCDYKLRSTVTYIRFLIEHGHISHALDLIQEHAPSVLNDHRLRFRLHKQKFIELLRSGNGDAQNQAIQCCRTVLGPCALDAYPEAYEEFKRLLLALIYDKEDENSPVFEEWAEAKRTELAAAVASVVKADLHAYDPLFSLSLRYLASTHNNYCLRQGVKLPMASAMETLLERDKDPPAAPRDCLLEAPSFQESDIQTLAHAVDLQRQGAVDSLRYTNGDLLTAFKNEISRIRINTTFLDELVHDYCVYRGLVDSYTTSSLSTDGHSSVTVADVGDEVGSSESMKRNVPMNTPMELQHNMGEETFQDLHTYDHASVAEEIIVDEPMESISDHSAACEPLQADNGNLSESLCSTSGTHKHHHDCVTLREKLVQGNILCRRWRGRMKLLNQSRYLEDDEQYALSVVEHIKLNCKSSNKSEEEKRFESEKYGLTLMIRELASSGMIDEAIQELNQIVPQFFEHNPHLLFQLKQVQFLKLVKLGDHDGALHIARTDMGPLAATYRDLMKPLKETVFALAQPAEVTANNPCSTSLVAAALQDALGASLGITETLLMKIIRTTLYTHTEWFKLQMCADPFGDLLKINDLKNTDLCSSRSFVENNKAGDASTMTSSHLTDAKGGTGVGDGSQQLSGSTADGSFIDGSAILTIMEFMALPRGDAIQLLMQYGGNVESVFEHLLS